METTERGAGRLAEVTLERPRQHLRDKYQLREPQVELMLSSAGQSLRHGLERLAAVLSGAEEKQALVGIYHGFKGLFLNMGEVEWAEYTRKIEGSLKKGDELDHGRIASDIRHGVAEVLSLEELKRR